MSTPPMRRARRLLLALAVASVAAPGASGADPDTTPPVVVVSAPSSSPRRARLVWAGVLRPGRGSGRYDAAFAKAVARFQAQRRVREPAGRGVLGPVTLRAMDRLALRGGWGASAGRG